MDGAHHTTKQLRPILSGAAWSTRSTGLLDSVDKILHASDQSWGVSVGDITIRVTAALASAG